MNKKLATVLVGAAVLFQLGGCGIKVEIPKKPDVQVVVADSSSTAHVYFRNQYKFSNSEIQRNEDGTYAIIITAIPPENLSSDSPA